MCAIGSVRTSSAGRRIATTSAGIVLDLMGQEDVP
jgi:hypothetical protein